MGFMIRSDDGGLMVTETMTYLIRGQGVEGRRTDLESELVHNGWRVWPVPGHDAAAPNHGEGDCSIRVCTVVLFVLDNNDARGATTVPWAG